jgi:hypothetical protein
VRAMLLHDRLRFVITGVLHLVDGALAGHAAA